MSKYAIIIHVNSPKLATNDLQEFYGLVTSAGYVPLDSVIQNIDSPDPKYFIGKGKAAQIQMALFDYFGDYVEKERSKLSLEEYYNPYDGIDIDFPDDFLPPSEIVAVFNNRLRNAQKRELSKIWAIDVLDRDDIILEIFEKNARTRQSKLQVELARLRLMADIVKADLGAHLDEKQGRDFKGKGRMGWEPKYRAYRERRKKIVEELEKIAKDRELRRKRRMNLFNIGIFGYTNAGKSTLLNRLTHAGVQTANEEFTTVSTTSRKLIIPNYDEFGIWRGEEVIITDSVGFIENMSEIVFDAFLATLEELQFSDMILIIIDVSESDIQRLLRKVETTFYVLERINAHTLPKLIVLNKIDKIPKQLVEERMQILSEQYPGIPMIPLSAKTGEGIEDLHRKLIEFKRNTPRLMKPIRIHSKAK